MRTLVVTLVACAAGLSGWAGPASARAEDGIFIQSMRVEGTIPKADSQLFDPNPYRKDRVPYARLNGQFGGDEFCVEVTQNKTRGVVYMNFGGDKKLKEQAEKLVGQRVVVECRGEYKLHSGKINQEDVAIPTLVLTVVKIEPVK
jgi:hypothetical protein